MSNRAWRKLNPYELHKTLINEYLLTTKSSLALLKRDTSKDKTDYDIIKENHKFLWNEKDEKNLDTWEKKLAKKYYDKLYREYCIADLSRYKENKFGLRWRTEQELVCGKGHFSCGNKNCTNNEELRTWEVNFGYFECGEKKNALVKLRLCPGCSYKLNYTHRKKEVKRITRSRKEKNSAKLNAADPVKNGGKKEECASGSDKMKEQNEESVEDIDDASIWTSKETPEEEKSREEEFEEYLQDLFL